MTNLLSRALLVVGAVTATLVAVFYAWPFVLAAIALIGLYYGARFLWEFKVEALIVVGAILGLTCWYFLWVEIQTAVEKEWGQYAWASILVVVFTGIGYYQILKDK